MPVTVDFPHRRNFRMEDIHMHRFWQFIPAAILLSAGTLAQCGTITILNPSFEDDVLGCSPGPNCATSDTITDWTGSTAFPGGFSGGPDNETGSFGVFKPGTSSYPGGVPDGVNVAYLSAIANSVSISQTLSATLQANDTYTLTVYEGLRDDTAVYPPGLGCNGSNIELEAGGTVLNSLDMETTVTCNTTRGNFEEYTVTYMTGASPAQLGDALEVVLTANGSGSTSEPSEIDFDQVSLSDTASPLTATPEPATLGMMAIALAGLYVANRRRGNVR
jgi:PEP-CTERM motif